MGKLDEEKKTVNIMIKLYCNKKHGTKDELCGECRELSEYACRRIDNCRFGASKGTCGTCKIHCYKPDMLEKISKVMRFSGPRMLYVHPMLVLRHIVDGFKKQ